MNYNFQIFVKVMYIAAFAGLKVWKQFQINFSYLNFIGQESPSEVRALLASHMKTDETV